MTLKQKSSRMELILITLVLIVSAACSVLKPAFNGETFEPLSAAPEINMTDHGGNPFQLSGLQGRIVLLFFGFTNCVDECPTTLAHIKLALGKLGDQAGEVQVVLISTDPIRDTPQALQDFLGKFDPSYLGITGTLDEMETIWQDYGVEVLDGGETHSSFVYVVDQQGSLRLKMDAEIDPEDMASDLKILLASE